MSSPSVPPPLDTLGERPFSFYPPILNVEHNEWVFLKGSWSEILVRNRKSGMEVWIPRSYVGEVSRIDEPVMIVGLKRELEYHTGAVWPHSRRVIELPRGAGDPRRPDTSGGERPAPGSRMRMESSAESRIGRLIVAALLLGIVACFVIISFFRQGASGSRVQFDPVLQMDLGFKASDDYFDVVRKLGPPEEDRWKSDAGERQYRALRYSRYSMTVILMGAERDKALYIGAKDKAWKNIHSVELPGGVKTDSILRNLKRF